MTVYLTAEAENLKVFFDIIGTKERPGRDLLSGSAAVDDEPRYCIELVISLILCC